MLKNIINNKKYMIKAKNGYVYLCSYCGEQVGSGKYCKDCKTQKDRKIIFDENVKIIKENEEKGFKVQQTIKNWK